MQNIYETDLLKLEASDIDDMPHCAHHIGVRIIEDGCNHVELIMVQSCFVNDVPRCGSHVQNDFIENRRSTAEL